MQISGLTVYRVPKEKEGSPIESVVAEEDRSQRGDMHPEAGKILPAGIAKRTTTLKISA